MADDKTPHNEELPPGYRWASDLVQEHEDHTTGQPPKKNMKGIRIDDPNWKWLAGSDGQGLDYSKPSDRAVYDQEMRRALEHEQKKKLLEDTQALQEIGATNGAERKDLKMSPTVEVKAQPKSGTQGKRHVRKSDNRKH